MSIERPVDEASTETVDNLVISLRAFVTPAPTKSDRRGDYPVPEKPSDWVLVFDCETRTTPDQRLRFGTYQLRYKGELWEHGAFYEPDVLDRSEIKTLRKVIEAEKQASDSGRVFVRTRADFVERVLYGRGHEIGAQIVGFNLPFDLSRLAIRHSPSRKNMRGGFSLELSTKKPAIAVKHLSQRAAIIRVTGGRNPNADPNAKSEADDERPTIDRGFFVDVKTLAAALTGQSHSLQSLSEILKIDAPKVASDEHGKRLTPAYVRYALQDVQATWECFENLSSRFSSFGLDKTGVHELYSEASLGKAYLKAMNVKPWREAQPDFPPEIIGHILGAYFGGRSEIHIRREIVPVIHCDFLSMYPTVCTLMGLWNFVRSTGITHDDCTKKTIDLISSHREDLIESLRSKSGWRDLATLVQVLPSRDLFPVRAEYPESDAATIGLNYLTSKTPLWFTLADVLTSKILTGKTPEVVSAIEFRPKAKQAGLVPIEVAGELIHPATDNFYRRLIMHRNSIKARHKAAPATEKPKLKSDEQGVKILANSTSYGIFVELNVEDHDKARQMVAYGATLSGFPFTSKKTEKPGRYFHPLLATLITGAARLMLALAEHRVIEEGLDWAFCDTDSVAIANINKIDPKVFKQKALRVRDWFQRLNPYGEQASILQLENVNFPVGEAGDLEKLEPVNCLTISAKRYVLFNREDDRVLIRKASGHGLGHLIAPYDEPPEQRRSRVERIGVPLWQEDLWKEIIRATDAGTPDEIDVMNLPGAGVPAASQYAATKPELLRWFNGYNECQPNGAKVFPFGFLLSLQAKSPIEMAADNPETPVQELGHLRQTRPAAPYFKKAEDAKAHAFDRETGEPVPPSWLKSHARSLVRYHLHQETKFAGGEYDQRGILTRRHVNAISTLSIGKEAEGIEENELIGEDSEPIRYPIPTSPETELKHFIFDTKAKYDISDRELCGQASVSHHTLADWRNGKRISANNLRTLAKAVEDLRRSKIADIDEKHDAFDKLRLLHKTLGSRNKVASVMGVSGPYIGRLLSGEKKISENFSQRLNAVLSV